MLAWLAGFLKKDRAQRVRLCPLSFVAVAAAAAVKIFALQVSSCIVDAGDFHAESVHTPTDPPPTTTRRLALQKKSNQENVKIFHFGLRGKFV